MDRREFSSLLPALLAATALLPEAAAQQPDPAKPKVPQPLLSSGVYKAGPPKNPGADRVSQSFTHGMLKAGNIQIEIHVTTQKVGAVHEPDGTHLHNEIWLVKEGVCELNINGVASCSSSYCSISGSCFACRWKIMREAWSRMFLRVVWNVS